MDTKEFSIILTQLSYSKLKFPILPTFFFVNNIFHKAFVNNSLFNIEQSLVRVGGPSTLLISILKDHEKLSLHKDQSNYLCVLSTQKSQKCLKLKKIKQILEGKINFGPSICLQKLKTGCKGKLTYSIKLSISGIKYKYKFFSVAKKTWTKCQDVFLKDQAKNLSKIVTSVLIKDTKSQISQVQVDFLCDSNHKLWIKYIKTLKDPKTIKNSIITSVILSSDSSQESINSDTSLKINNTLKRSSTLTNRKIFRIRTLDKKNVYKKQLTTIVSKKCESENDNSDESLESSLSEEEDDEDEAEDNFFEIIAREKYKKQYQALGNVGKMTPDNEMLVKEMKIIKKSFTSPKLPNIQPGIKKSTEQIRKTLPYIRIPNSFLGSLKYSVTKN